MRSRIAFNSVLVTGLVQLWMVLQVSLHCAHALRFARTRMARTRMGSRYYGDSGHSQRYSSRHTVPEDVLRRRGGIGFNKTGLFQAGSVYIASSLRRLLVSSSGGLLRDDVNYETVTVCEASYSGYRYVVCPTDAPVGWSSYRDAGVDPNTELYCCGRPPAQDCCDREDFYRQYGSLQQAATVLVILLVVGILVGGLACLAGAGVLAYCYYWKRPGRGVLGG